MAILNWLVQGCIVAALSAAVLRLLKNARAQSRYTFCSIALAIVLLLPLLSLVPIPVVTTTSGAPGVAMPGALISVPNQGWNWTIALTLLCAVWSCLSGLQFAIEISALRRARRGCRAFPSELEARLRHWTNVRERGRSAQLMLSDDVRAAAVLSGTVPIIAVAPSVLDHLTAEEVDRLIIHEWAHVQRRDDAAQLIQVICRMVAGWHPAVSWLNRRLHDERESACDEMVVALMGSPKAYAASLVKLAALPRVQVPRLPAVGALSSSGLAARIRRIVSERELFSLRWSRNAVAVSTILLAAVSSAVAALRIVETAAASSISGTSGQLVAAVDVQSRVLTQPDSPRASEATFIPKRSESGRRPLKTPQPRVVRNGAVPREETRVAHATVTASQAPASPENSAPAALPATPLPSIVTHTSVGPVPVAQTSGLNQSADTLAQTAGDPGSPPPWITAANAGKAVGQGSKNAGVATAGFFTRIGKRIAGSF